MTGLNKNTNFIIISSIFFPISYQIVESNAIGLFWKEWWQCIDGRGELINRPTIHWAINWKPRMIGIADARFPDRSPAVGLDSVAPPGEQVNLYDPNVFTRFGIVIGCQPWAMVSQIQRLQAGLPVYNLRNCCAQIIETNQFCRVLSPASATDPWVFKPTLKEY